MGAMKYKIYPYYSWETYSDGMYSDIQKGEASVKYDFVYSMFMNQDLFFSIGLQMMAFYKNACITFLRNKSINRRAFIGQASACYQFRCPEYVTREVWGNIPEFARLESNQTANKLIKIYEERCINVYK